MSRYHTVRMEIIPHDGDGAASGVFAEAYQFQVPWTVCQTGVHGGAIASGHAPYRWVGHGLAFSSMKVSEASGDLMLRWFNMEADETELELQSSCGMESVYKSNVLEETGPQVADDAGSGLTLSVRSFEIVTLGF